MRRVLLAGAVALAGCGGASAAAPADVTVEDAWARPTPPGLTDAAIYLRVTNGSAPADHLAGMSSDRCSTIIPHRTVIDGDVASMPGILGDELALPTGGEIVMEPNGLHLMCLGLGSPLGVGDEFTLELTFDTHAPIDVTVRVRES